MTMNMYIYLFAAYSMCIWFANCIQCSIVLCEQCCPLWVLNIELSHGWPDIPVVRCVNGTAHYCVLIQDLRVHPISELCLCIHIHTRKQLLPLFYKYAHRLVQVWEPPSCSSNHVRTAWHYRKIMMCRPVGSFISMFYNRRRVEVIKLCHHYNEPGPPLNRHPMRH